MRQYPEVELVAAQIGRPDDGTDPTGFYNAEIFVPLQAAAGLADVGQAPAAARDGGRGPSTSWSTR